MLARVIPISSAQRHAAQQALSGFFELEKFILINKDGVLIERYIRAFPAFDKAVRRMEFHIGFDLKIEGYTLLGKSIISAIRQAGLEAETNALSYTQVQQSLVVNFVKRIAEITSWCVTTDADQGPCSWDVSSEPFPIWLERNGTTKFKVIPSAVPPTVEDQRGLQARLLCKCADNSLVGQVLGKL